MVDGNDEAQVLYDGEEYGKILYIHIVMQTLGDGAKFAKTKQSHQPQHPKNPCQLSKPVIQQHEATARRGSCLKAHICRETSWKMPKGMNCKPSPPVIQEITKTLHLPDRKKP